MQRWLFFLSFLCSGTFVAGQSVDVVQTELSFWFSGNLGETDSIPAEAIITFDAISSIDQILLTSKHLIINDIRKHEGRLKGALQFSRQGDSIVVKGPWKSGKNAIHIDFVIPTESDDYLNFVQRTDAFTALNPFNIGEPTGSGVAGKFFPAIPEDPFQLRVNITFPKGNNSSVPGTLDFITDNQDGSKSHYWSSRNEYSAEQFFLIVGKFEEHDPEHLEEEFDFVKIDPTKLVAQQIKPVVDAILERADTEEEEFADSTYVLLDSLAQEPMDNFYLEHEDVSEVTDSAQFRLEKKVFLHIEDADTSAASEQLLDYYLQEQGQDWGEGLISEKWERFSDLNTSEQRITMELKLERWRGDNAFLEHLDRQRIDTAFAEPLLKHLQPPAVEVSYRYRSSDTAQYIIYSQDTAQAPPYHIPVKIRIITRRDTIIAHRFMTTAEGELKIRSQNTPSFVEVSPGSNFPGTFSDNPPDNYLLFQLSNAESPEARRRALQRLYNTANKNLFSTVLGIGMDDEDPQVRLEAVKRADDLDAAAQRKLRRTLEDLAQNDPNEEIQKVAKELVQKYYNPK